MSSGDSAPRTMVRFSLRGLSRRIVVWAATGVVALALVAAIAALIVRLSPGTVGTVAQHPAAPPLPAMALDSTAPANLSTAQAALESPSRPFAPVVPDNRTQDLAPSESAGPSPQPKLAMPPPLKDAPTPPQRPVEFASPGVSPAGPFDQWTAIYVLTTHRVYMPDGTNLEAHSGLGDRLDDPRHVDEKDYGATPPHLYDLALRDGIFHGVQALRLNPVGGESTIFGREGLLAHPYMLGPNGDSNGCVSFKNYDAFLQAFQSGKVKRLAVVASLN